MRVRHTIAAGLIAILTLQATGFAQRQPDQAMPTDDVIDVPHQVAVHRLFEALMKARRKVRVEISGGEVLEGVVLDVSADDVIVADDGLRRVVPISDIVGLRPRGRSGMQSGTAFSMGAGIGAAVILIMVRYFLPTT
jgi:hypothetical protein